ncbi:hypothetical protein BK636_01965 [Pseudomonas chlororaphis]|uniref:hypothetical protein n=1 Tax=Pseudomonas chlororaphis TaxID=587753 RepID=UPI000F4AE21E|nr:hypothetical protein [Pseudomonas chlororaphis]ROL94140.1 hypothetical protein BK636_01965 [Pseudomonas chlororaphis]
MPELAKKAPRLEQGGTKTFKLFDQDNILITLDLPGVLNLILDEVAVYPTIPDIFATPKFTNNTPYPVISATFTIELGSIYNNSQQVIASAQWQNPDNLQKQGSMSFTCKNVAVGQEIQCKPDTDGFTKVRWQATRTSGEGTELLNNSLTLVSLTLGPVKPKNIPATGPDVTVSGNN